MVHIDSRVLRGKTVETGTAWRNAGPLREALVRFLILVVKAPSFHCWSKESTADEKKEGESFVRIADECRPTLCHALPRSATLCHAPQITGLREARHIQYGERRGLVCKTNPRARANGVKA
jgi:hypothetical protein